MGIFDKLRGKHVRIRIVVGEVDEHVRVPAGTTLGTLVAVTDAAGIPLREALDRAQVDTLRINGEVCPFIENAERVLVEGDEISLPVTAGR